MEPTHAVKAFQALNRTRIERLSALLPTKAQFFLDALPLLFQTNSNVLPGFINHEAPAGIVDYQPSNTTLDAAKKLHHSFQYKRHSLHHYSIRGLYLINDNGLLNTQQDPEFELWLIYAQPITDEHLELLQQKITAICEWAHAELKITLIPRLLKETTLTGTAISAFARDRFYRSGLYLAGCIPSWWVTPSESNNETEHHRGHHQDLLEFGVLPSQVEVSQLIRCVINQLHISMNADLTACLDLIYYQTLLKQYPLPLWPSVELKHSIYNDEPDPMLLDSHTLKLQLITAASDDKDTHFLAQQSFYVLSKERLSQTVTHAAYPWRRSFIEQQVATWSWPKETIIKLDQRSLSHYRQALTEYQQISMHIANTMQILFLFAQQHKINIEQHRRELEQAFKVLFQSDNDSINRLAPAFIPKNHEDSVYLSRHSVANGWQINDRPTDSANTPLYQHSSLVNVVAWAVNNHVLAKATRLKVADQTHKVTMPLVLDLVQQLLRSPLSSIPNAIDSDQLNKPADITQLLLFTNIEHQPVNSLSLLGLELSSLQADPLNYANSKQSLVASIEGLIYTTWGQWHYFFHTGKTALLDTLSTIIQWMPKQDSILNTTCWCPSENHGKKISDRIEAVYHDVISHYINHPISGDYVIAIADQLYQLQWQQGLCDILPLAKNKSLIQHLAQDRTVFSATRIDPLLDKDGLIRTLLAYQVEHHISLFLFTHSNVITLYIMDNLGNLFEQQVIGLTEATLISHFQQFISKIEVSHQINAIQLLRLVHIERTAWQITKITTKANIAAKQVNYLPVTIELDSLNDDSPCAIHCGPKSFHGSVNDPKLFKQVSDLVLSLRNSTTRYPLYITQISFTTPYHYTTQHYITLKQQLEYQLNKA